MRRFCFKRCISVLLCLCLAAAGTLLLSGTASAATEGPFSYSVSNGKATITDFDDTVGGDIVIPATLGGAPVTAVGGMTFYKCAQITSVTIPDSVTEISYEAFIDCGSLTGIWVGAGNPSYSSDENGVLFNKDKTSLVRCPGGYAGAYTIPDTVMRIGVDAFRECDGLTALTIPDGVDTIEVYAFYGCNGLTEIAIPESVTMVWADAFTFCRSLTCVSIGAGVTDLFGGNLFYGCEKLTEIRVDANNPSYSSDENGVLFDKDKTRLLRCPEGYTGAYTIPDSVTDIAAEAFDRCVSLTEITIPNGVTNLGNYAFYGCAGLTEITIPASVTSIGEKVFVGCENVCMITFDGACPTLAANSFADVTAIVLYPAGDTSWDGKTGQYGGSLRWVNADDFGVIASGLCGEDLAWSLRKDGVLSITGYGEMAQYSYDTPAPWNDFCRVILRVELPEQLTAIGKRAFYGCENLASVAIPNSVTQIGDSAFSGCTSLTSVVIPDGVTKINWSVFSGCTSLTSVVIPDGVTEINGYAFSRCASLTEIIIPDSVTFIDMDAFYNCDSLTSIYVPRSVTYIGSSVFSDCNSLTEIWVDENNPNYSSDASGVLFNKAKTELICCPSGFSGAYSVPNSVTQIGSNAFADCDGLTDVTIPNSVTDIGTSAFYGCGALTEITIPDSVTSVDSGVFSYCDSLKKVTLPAGVTSIGNNTFSHCSSLTEIDLPSAVTSIGNNAFYHCGNLTEITIPSGVTSIGDWAFSNCGSLAEVSIGSGVTSIGINAFYNCYSLTEITIPSSVTSIGNGAFGSCSLLRDVRFMGAAPKIQQNPYPLYTGTFYDVTATCYYPEEIGGTVTWISEKRENYGGSLTWKPWFTLGSVPDCAHSFTDSVVPPSCTWGYVLHTCACGYSYRTNFVGGSGHDWDAPVWTWDGFAATASFTCRTDSSHVEAVTATVTDAVTTPAACEIDGERTYTAAVTHDGKTFTDTKTDVVPATGHKWGKPAWSWDGTAAAATFTCQTDSTHQETVAATVTSEVTRPATCEREGLQTYTAKVTFCDQTYTATKTAAIPAAGHKWGAPTWTWHTGNWDVREAYATFTCQTDSSHVKTLYSAPISEVTTPATCEQAGVMTYTATVTLDGQTYADVTTDTIKPLGHAWDAPVWTWDGFDATASFTCRNDSGHTEVLTAMVTNQVQRAPTCETEGTSLYTAQVTLDGWTHDDTKTESIPAMGHAWETPVWTWNGDKATAEFICTNDRRHVVTLEAAVTSEVTTPATCEGEGVRQYTATVTLDGVTYTDATAQTLPALGHSYTDTVTDPTCTEQGYTTHICARCGDSFTDTYVDALGHKWDEGKVTTKPTETEAGVKTYTCERCGATKTEEIPATGSWENPFVDVNTGKWYAKAVRFVTENGYMKGITDTTFEPNAPMTRGMMVTILYRAEGEPEVAGKTHPFTDVANGRYFTKPVIWAYREGIVSGITDTTFEPNTPVTREQLATILFRYAKAEAVEADYLTQFPDVGKLHSYAKKSMNWAVAEGLITGNKAGDAVNLDPRESATRAQIATILMRYLQNAAE